MSETSNPGISGRGPWRDRYNICLALGYAIATINSLPVRWRETSNAADMEILLDHFAEGFMDSEYFIELALRHINGAKENANG